MQELYGKNKFFVFQDIYLNQDGQDINCIQKWMLTQDPEREASVEVPETCVLLNDQQRAAPQKMTLF